MTSDQYLTVRRDGSLNIERVRLEDAGDYTCLAENVVGATNHTTTVKVSGNELALKKEKDVKNKAFCLVKKTDLLKFLNISWANF